MSLAEVARLPTGSVNKGMVKRAKAPISDIHRDRDDSLIGITEEAYRLRNTQIVQIFTVAFTGMELEIAAEAVRMNIKGRGKVFP